MLKEFEDARSPANMVVEQCAMGYKDESYLIVKKVVVELTNNSTVRRHQKAMDAIAVEAERWAILRLYEVETRAYTRG